MNFVAASLCDARGPQGRGYSSKQNCPSWWLSALILQKLLEAATGGKD